MPILLSCLSGCAVLAALVLSGAFAAIEFSHPFWQMRASLTGGAVGAILAAGLLWLIRRKPSLSRVMGSAVGVALGVAGFVTWRAARKFIDSDDFEPLAGQIWFLGYHISAALIVAFVALIAIRRLRQQDISSG